jgi:RNA polymerase sigma-70 factor (ECF subfamily)
MDITQDTFLRLWKQFERGQRIDNPRAWLLRVARNLAEDYGKSSFRRNGTHPPEVMNLVRARHDSPLERLERAETFARLREALAELSITDRELLSYRYVLGYDAAKLAQLFSTSVTAIHMRLSRARQRLSERLTAEGIKLNP